MLVCCRSMLFSSRMPSAFHATEAIWCRRAPSSTKARRMLNRPRDPPQHRPTPSSRSRPKHQHSSSSKRNQRLFRNRSVGLQLKFRPNQHLALSRGFPINTTVPFGQQSSNTEERKAYRSSVQSTDQLYWPHLGLYSMMWINVENNGTTADTSRNTNPFPLLYYIIHYVLRVYIYFSRCSHPCYTADIYKAVCSQLI